jgi:hypothetical protein
MITFELQPSSDESDAEDIEVVKPAVTTIVETVVGDQVPDDCDKTGKKPKEVPKCLPVPCGAIQGKLSQKSKKFTTYSCGHHVSF